MFPQPFSFLKNVTESVGDTAFITTFSGGSAANNFAGMVGMEILVGASPITVTELGRWVVAGNSGSHLLHLTDATGADLGTISVNTSGATTSAFLYGTLSSPVVLSAATRYAILSQEANAGDQWLDNITVTASAAGATADKYAYFPDGGSYSVISSGTFAGPTNFKFH